MTIFNSDSSPFMVLWYLFLVFFGIVIVVNVLALLMRGFITWRTNRLIKRSHHEEKHEEKSATGQKT